MIYDPNSKQNGMDRKGAKMLHELATLTYGKVQYLNAKEGILWGNAHCALSGMPSSNRILPRHIVAHAQTIFKVYAKVRKSAQFKILHFCSINFKHLAVENYLMNRMV